MSGGASCYAYGSQLYIGPHSGSAASDTVNLARLWHNGTSFDLDYINCTAIGNTPDFAQFSGNQIPYPWGSSTPFTQVNIYNDNNCSTIQNYAGVNWQ